MDNDIYVTQEEFNKFKLFVTNQLIYLNYNKKTKNSNLLIFD